MTIVAAGSVGHRVTGADSMIMWESFLPCTITGYDVSPRAPFRLETLSLPTVWNPVMETTAEGQPFPGDALPKARCSSSPAASSKSKAEVPKLGPLTLCQP